MGGTGLDRRSVDRLVATLEAARQPDPTLPFPLTDEEVEDLRHTAATLAAASGASLRALMARIGHASAAAAIRYPHVIDGQDSDIVDYLERFDRAPARHPISVSFAATA